MNNHTVEKHGMSPELCMDLSATWTGAIHFDVEMAEYCTFKAGGKADALLQPSSRSELEALLHWLRKNKVNWKVIGRGSNILVQSRGYNGVVIVLGGDFCSISSMDEPVQGSQTVKVRVGAGCSVARLIGWCSLHELSGLEFMVGIPGSVGGAVCMNAGAWGNEIGESVDAVSYIDPAGEIHDVSRDGLDFSYRQLQFKEEPLEEIIIIETVLRLKPGKQNEIIAQCKNYLKQRRVKQPLGVASAGSFFKNPPGDSAGRLIDDAGLKGLRRGNATVSTRHANFLVNTGLATADDIIELMREVQQRVYQHSGVMLEPEVHLL